MSSCATTAPPTPGYRDFRGAIETAGQFALTDRWTWGWDGILPTDQTFFQDYHLSTYQRGTSMLQSGLTEGVSQLYLTGRGDRSYFDVRTIYYYGFSEADVQKQIPVIHPVLDYSYIFNNPLFGGEARLPHQPDEPVAQHRLLRSDQLDGVQLQPVRADKR